jgi:dCMP deaminase
MENKKYAPKIPSFDDRMMSMGYIMAEGSKDKRTHIFALVTGPDNEIRTTGYNSFPRRLNDNLPERQEKPEKKYWFEHAERNAVYNATLIGASLKGCKMYTNGIPCTDCARGIVQSGILEVIVDEEWNKSNSGEDLEESRRTIQMFRETGVKIRYWKGKLIRTKKYRRGEIIEISD